MNFLERLLAFMLGTSIDNPCDCHMVFDGPDEEEETPLVPDPRPARLTGTPCH